MQSLRISRHPDSARHECEGTAHGEWIVYTCPQCDYQLWDNTTTGAMEVHNPKRDVRHSGRFVSPEAHAAGTIRFAPDTGSALN